jgi:hypothetical protein
MLTGQTLLDTVKSMETATKAELCEATGYVSTNSEGKTSYLWTTLQTALIEAAGIDLPVSRGGGPRASYTTQTLTNGHVVVGRCYASLLGAQKGDRWDIEVDETNREIVLRLSE